MAVELVRADLEKDSEQITRVLQRNLPGLPHARRFEWLYRNNPAGEAWSWLIREASTQEPIGVASVFPRTIWLGGEKTRCGQVGDFAIDLNYRSLGPAVMLQRATFEPVDQGRLAFCYDCPPHGQGMAPFHRLGIKPHCRVERYARLQRSRRELEKVFGRGKLSGSLSYLFDVFLTKRRFRHRRNSGIETALHPGRFGDEFTVLDEKVGGKTGIRGRRGAEELNWRYMEDPLNSYRTVTAHRDRELVGYAVFASRGEDAFVIDLLALEIDDVAPILLDAIAENVKAESAQALYVLAGEQSGIARFLRRQGGFQFRSHAASVVVYAGSSTAAHEVSRRYENWFFTHADMLA